MRRLLAPALIALVCVGCGSSPAAQTDTTSGAGTASTADRGRDRLIRFSECMRKNGLSDFPDPDAKGEFQYGISVSPAVWQKTLEACKTLRPAGSFSSKRTPQQQSDGLKFAECMRANGVKDFPDPVNGEPLINTYKIPSSNQPGGMAILNAAVDQCKTPLNQAAAGQ